MKTSETAKDPYIAYIHRFFRAWLPVYDWFARSIFWTYRATVRRIGSRPGLTVLDVCTGTGEIALRCARGGLSVTGIDITPEMLAKAETKAAAQKGSLNVRFEVMDARALEFPDRSFDVAVIAFALHDMPRAVRVMALREAARVARERLVILDYDLGPSRLWRRVWIGLISLFESAYFRSFAAEGLPPVLADAGLVDLGMPAPRTVRVARLFPFLFSIYEITL